MQINLTLSVIIKELSKNIETKNNSIIIWNVFDLMLFNLNLHFCILLLIVLENEENEKINEKVSRKGKLKNLIFDNSND